MKRIFSLFATLMVTMAVMAADYVSVNFTVSPQMTCQNCENKIKTNIRYEKGVKQIETSLSDQIVTIKYDAAKTNPEKIADAFKKIGYTATVVSGNAACAAKQGCGKSAKGCCGSGKDCKGQKHCGEKKECGEKKHCGEKKECGKKKECPSKK